MLMVRGEHNRYRTRGALFGPSSPFFTQLAADTDTTWMDAELGAHIAPLAARTHERRRLGTRSRQSSFDPFVRQSDMHAFSKKSFHGPSPYQVFQR